MIDLDPEVDSSACLFCGNPELTERFRRVYGDNDDVAHRCPECDNYRRLTRGSAAGIDLPGHPDPQESVGHHGNAVVTDGGRRRDRGQTSVGWLVFTIVALGLSAVPLLVVMAA